MEQMSRLIGKPIICIGENKDADQLRGNREADQRLCFRYSDSTIPLLLKCEFSSFIIVDPNSFSRQENNPDHMQVQRKNRVLAYLASIQGRYFPLLRDSGTSQNRSTMKTDYSKITRYSKIFKNDYSIK